MMTLTHDDLNWFTCHETICEIQSLKESRDNAISIAELEEADARHTLESKLSNAEYELGQGQQRQKTAGAQRNQQGCEALGQVTLMRRRSSCRTGDSIPTPSRCRLRLTLHETCHTHPQYDVA